ncbi:MAG: alanine--tRNA ligase [Gammaproteobacteria bacterium]
MQTKTLGQIRQAFLDFFVKKGHALVPSSQLIPLNDPTLLFTNAGMVQFKDVFLGQDKRNYSRATSSQRCIRAGGKHNDLENVGYTARHHTFFEMLGNFSFGDYFKREAIQYAWEFLTQVLELPREKLWITVYEEDQEAEKIWLEEIGISAKQFSRCGMADNFWAMGDTGPCGPCSEIYYDHGATIAGGPPGSGEDGDRYVEIWNLVFMQYNRNAQGELSPLPKPSVDTGMGLERIAAVMQGVHSNYDIDLFQHIIRAIQDLDPKIEISNHKRHSLNVLADHIRSTVFLIMDGVLPSNEGRGYVLRRIMRRALRHGQQLGFKLPFFHHLVSALSTCMGDFYPELEKSKQRITEAIRAEEEQFDRTLSQGLKIFKAGLEQLEQLGSTKMLPAELVFKLYDTYGFPVDLTADMARERNLEIDTEGFQALMAQQKERARVASQFSVQDSKNLEVGDLPPTEFLGYETLEHSAKILKISETENPRIFKIVLDKTPFYPEGGGQVGDLGLLQQAELGLKLKVLNTYKIGKIFIHEAESEFLEDSKQVLKALKVGLVLKAQVFESTRLPTMRNHSATHLMHAALRKVLGEHVIQKGSLVDAQRLRFDFTHNKPLTAQEIEKISNLVNAEILRNTPVKIEHLNLEQAKSKGAMALFGEKYDEVVRTLSMGQNDFSIELCGGTHVSRTGDIGLFHLLSETGIASGVRRIEAITGEAAYVFFTQTVNTLKNAQGIVEAQDENFLNKLQDLKQNFKKANQELEALKIQNLQTRFAKIMQESFVLDTQSAQGVQVLLKHLDFDLEPQNLRVLIQEFKSKHHNQKALIVLGAKFGDKAYLAAGLSSDLVAAKLSAQDLIKKIAVPIQGNGGGKADFAQAGGSDVSGLEKALKLAMDLLKTEYANK